MTGTASLPNFQTFGALLHYLRRGARLSQRELAIAVGYSESMISRLEHDERPPDVATILALFVPALHLRQQPEAVDRLTELAQAARGEQNNKTLLREQAASKRQPFAAQHRLPVRLTSFIGREEDVRAVARLLARARLVTLTGPGGCGKTSLAVETARWLAENGERAAVQADSATPRLDDIYLVELLPLNDPALLPQTILTALGLEGNPQQPARQTLIRYLADRRALFVLDNCEHLVDGVTRLVEELLRGCPNLRILATSRERLNIGAETVYVVAPLAFPPTEPVRGLGHTASDPADYSTAYPAVQLLVERAQAIAPGFHLDANNIAAVLHICEILEGSPLALELVAAATATFSVSEIAQQLDARLLLAGPGYRTADPRHRQLRDTVDWSYRLLSAAEQQMLVHLAVFTGGWTVDALRSVLGGEAIDGSDCVALLHQLVRKSLVRAEQEALPSGTRTRFHLLRAIREFAAERLADNDQGDNVGRRHFAYYAQFAVRWGEQVLGPQHRQAMAELDGDYHNIRAAVQFSLGQPELTEARLRLAAALPYYWQLRSSSLGDEGIAWLNAAFDSETVYPITCQAQAFTALLNVYGLDPLNWMMVGIDRPPGTQELSDRAAALVEPCLAQGDRRSTAYLLLALSRVLLGPQELVQCRAYAQRAAQLLEDIGDTLGIGFARILLAWGQYAEGQIEAARTMLADNLRLVQQGGSAWALCDAYRLQTALALRANNMSERIHYLKLQIALGEREGFTAVLHGSFYILEHIDGALAKQMAEAFLERQRQKGESMLLGLALHQLGRMCVHDQQFERAAVLLDEAIGFWRRGAGKQGHGLALQWSLIDRGRAAYFLGDYATAFGCYDESIAIFSASPYSGGGGFPLLYRAYTWLAQGDLPNAENDFHRCVKAVSKDLVSWQKLVVRAFAGIAEIAYARGDIVFSGKLFGAMAALDAASEAPSAQARFGEVYEFLRTMAAAAERRSDPLFEAAWQEGEKLTLQQAVDLTLEA